MSDLIQTVVNQGPMATMVSFITCVVNWLTHSRFFAKHQDIELAISKVSEMVAKEYLAKSELDPIRNELNSIVDRLDRIFVLLSGISKGK